MNNANQSSSVHGSGEVTSYDEEQIIAAVIDDESGSLLRKTQHLPVEAFSDPECARMWSRLLSLPSGTHPGLVLVGANDDSIRRFTTTKNTTLYFSSHAYTLLKSWAEKQAKLYAVDFQRGKLSLDRFSEDLAGLVKSVNDPSANSRAWPVPVSANSLCANPPPTPEMLIKGVLYRGGTMLLSGPSKAHKTYAMLTAGMAIAEGRPWLGFETTKAPVIYLNLELQDFAANKRIEQIAQATGTRPPVDFIIWNLRGRRVTLAELQARLPTEITRLGAGAVMIDPHYKVSALSGGEENSNDSQGLLLSALEGICATNGAALVLSHHFAKGDASAKNSIDRASGGGVFARWGDVMMTFTPHEEDEAMAVEMALRNFAPVEPFVVRWEYPLWVRDDQLDPAKLKRVGGRTETNTADKALNALGAATMGYGEWMKASGMTETTFRRKLKALLEAGRVEQVGNLYRRKTA